MSNGLSIPATFPPKRQMTEETVPMKAIVVTDQAAGTAGMKLVERPEPQGAALASLSGANYGDVIVQVHASGFTGDELAWPSTWIDRLGRDRTPSIPRPRAGRSGHRPQLWDDGAVGGTAGVRPHGLGSRRHAGGVCSRRGTQPRAAAGRR